MSAKFDLCLTFTVLSRDDDSHLPSTNAVSFTVSALNEQTDIHSRGTRLFGFRVPLPAEQLRSANARSSASRQSGIHASLLATLFLQMYWKFSRMDDGSLKTFEQALLEISSDPAHRDRLWLEQARAILDEEFAEQPPLSVIAAKVGVHPVHLAREFRRRYGSTIGEYVRKLRVEFACHQLLASDDPPVKIATAAGFADQSHFSRTFKRFLGTTPGRYRAALRAGYSGDFPNRSANRCNA